MGTKLNRPLLFQLFNAYALDHARTLISSLGRLYRNSFSSLMTVAVIGIALALPSGLYVILKNLQSATGGWDSVAQISLFLKTDISLKQMQGLAQRLEVQDDISAVTTIPADQALEDFRQHSGFAEALDSLDENPLPHVIVVTPALKTHFEVKGLVNKLNHLPEVEIAALDMQWLQRLQAMMDIARHVVIAIAIMLAFAVLLIVGNTIRLEIQSRENEIKVVKLVGGTDAFIRRPFLYEGLWYGLCGGFLAWSVVHTLLALVEDPAQHLAILYHSQYHIRGLDGLDTLSLFTLSALLGLIGSWLAVGKHLGAIEPQ
jgi:cell division transport system permease protein